MIGVADSAKRWRDYTQSVHLILVYAISQERLEGISLCIISSLGLKDELIRIYCAKVKVTVNSQKLFLPKLKIHLLIMTKFHTNVP